jgi:hypothetical protein
MGTTTFSGPIKAGTIKDTTGTTVGENIQNTGFVLMSQSKVVALTGATANTTVAVIPANSQIVEVFADVTVVSNDTGAANVSVGNASNATAYIAVSNAKVTGRLTAVNAAIISSAFFDVGTSDSRLTAVFQAGTGDGTTGSAVVTVYYLQDRNLA